MELADTIGEIPQRGIASDIHLKLVQSASFAETLVSALRPAKVESDFRILFNSSERPVPRALPTCSSAASSAFRVFWSACLALAFVLGEFSKTSRSLIAIRCFARLRFGMAASYPRT